MGIIKGIKATDSPCQDQRGNLRNLESADLSCVAMVRLLEELMNVELGGAKIKADEGNKTMRSNYDRNSFLNQLSQMRLHS